MKNKVAEYIVHVKRKQHTNEIKKLNQIYDSKIFQMINREENKPQPNENAQTPRKKIIKILILVIVGITTASCMLFGFVYMIINGIAGGG